MDRHLALSLFALAVSLASLIYMIVQGRKTKALYAEMRNRHAAEQEHEAWTRRQIQRWHDGELEARLEPATFGGGEQYVIEPVPGHKVVVGSVRNGKLH